MSTSGFVQRVQVIPKSNNGITLADLDAALELDASISEGHTIEVEATEHPVELGADVTDHARRKPDELTVEGIVSNVMIRTQAERDVAGEQPIGQPGRAENAYSRLLDLTVGRLTRIVTTLRTYDDMLIRSISVPRSARDGDVVRFTMRFRKVVTATSQTIELRTVTPDSQPKVLRGKKTTIEVTPPDQPRSALKHFTDSIGFTKSGSGIAAP